MSCFETCALDFQTEEKKKRTLGNTATLSLSFSHYSKTNSTDEFDSFISLKIILLDFLESAAEMLGLGKIRTWLKVHSALGQTCLSTEGLHLHQVQAASLKHVLTNLF